VVEVWCHCCRPLVVVKVEAGSKVGTSLSVSFFRRRSFCASRKDENGLVSFRTVFKLSNFLFNHHRFRTRVRSLMCASRSWRLSYMVFI
jgi:hypothetical protein